MPTKRTKHLWTWMSRYIRLRDSYQSGFCICPTCNHAASPKDMEAGHCFPKGSYKYRSLEFNEMNVAAQCGGCNNWRMRQPEYQERFERHIRERWGDKKIDDMLALALSGKDGKRSEYKINAQKDYYKQRTYELLKEKGIERWWRVKKNGEDYDD